MQEIVLTVYRHSRQLPSVNSSANVLWLPTIANNMDPDQTAPLGAV